MWIESVYDCMDEVQKDTETRARISAAGCTEVASVDCPRCGSSSLDSARFCKSCGTQLFRDLSDEDDAGGKKKPTLKIIAAIAFFIILIAAAGRVSRREFIRRAGAGVAAASALNLTTRGFGAPKSPAIPPHRALEVPGVHAYPLEHSIAAGDTPSLTTLTRQRSTTLANSSNCH